MPNAREDISETGTVGGLLAQLIDKDLDRRIVVMDAGFIRPIRPGDVKFSKFHYDPVNLSDSEDLCLICPGPVDAKGLETEVKNAADRLAKGFALTPEAEETGARFPDQIDGASKVGEMVSTMASRRGRTGFDKGRLRHSSFRQG